MYCFDVNVIRNYLFPTEILRFHSIDKGVLFQTFDVNVQVQNVPEPGRQAF